MSRKINYKTVSPFHDRLCELLGKNTQKWAKELGISKGTITNVWLKGSYPGADKIIKICEVTGRSADWLLFGNERETVTCKVGCSSKEQEYGKKAVAVLRSKTGYKDSLKMNIDSFYESVLQKELYDQELAKVQEENQKTVDRYEREIELLKEEVKLLKEGLNKKPPEPKRTKGNKNLTYHTDSGTGENQEK